MELRSAEEHRTEVMAQLHLTILLLIIISFSCSCSSKADLQVTKQRGDRVVSALIEYETKEGTYPEKLEQLVPEYLGEIPQPTWGLKLWKYSLDSGKFHLSVDESERTGDGNSHWLKYMGPEWKWQYGD